MRTRRLWPLSGSTRQLLTGFYGKGRTCQMHPVSSSILGFPKSKMVSPLFCSKDHICTWHSDSLWGWLWPSACPQKGSTKAICGKNLPLGPRFINTIFSLGNIWLSSIKSPLNQDNCLCFICISIDIWKTRMYISC